MQVTVPDALTGGLAHPRISKQEKARDVLQLIQCAGVLVYAQPLRCRGRCEESVSIRPDVRTTRSPVGVCRDRRASGTHGM